MTVNRNGSNQAETSVAAAAALRTIQDELSDFKLNRFHAERLPSFLNDFDTIMDAVRTGHSQLVDTACELEQYGQSSEIQALEDCLTVYIDAENKLAKQKEIFNNLSGRIRREEPLHDVVQEYNKLWDREMAKYRAMSDKSKYYINDQYREFKQSVWDVHHPDEPIPAFGGGGNDEDEDIVVGQTKLSLKCPITQTWFENPVTSKSCKHTFSKDAIFTLIRRNRGRVECPVPGCSKLLTQNDFYQDYRMERRVERAQALADNQTDYYDVE